MLPILNLAIGLVFVFLLFSLVVSALNELILYPALISQHPLSQFLAGTEDDAKANHGSVL